MGCSKVFHVEPEISVEKARSIIEKSLKGFFRRKGVLGKGRIVYYPFYEVEADIRSWEPKRRMCVIVGIVEKYVRLTLLIDAIKGFLCNYILGKGITKVFKIAGFSDIERRIIKLLLKSNRSLSLSEIADNVGVSRDNVEKCLDRLSRENIVSKGVSGWKVSSTVWTFTLVDPKLLSSISKSIKLKEGLPLNGRLEPKVNVEDIEYGVEVFWEGRVNDYWLTYYPYYMGKVTYGSGVVKTVAVDMVSCRICDEISELVKDIEASLPL